MEVSGFGIQGLCYVGELLVCIAFLVQGAVLAVSAIKMKNLGSPLLPADFRMVGQLKNGGLHLLGGILALFYVALRARRLARAPAKRVVVDVTAVYWHFMDALWIYILLLLTVRS